MADIRKKEAILGIKATPSKHERALIKPILSHKRVDRMTPNRNRMAGHAGSEASGLTLGGPSVAVSQEIKPPLTDRVIG